MRLCVNNEYSRDQSHSISWPNRRAETSCLRFIMTKMKYLSSFLKSACRVLIIKATLVNIHTSSIVPCEYKLNMKDGKWKPVPWRFRHNGIAYWNIIQSKSRCHSSVRFSGVSLSVKKWLWSATQGIGRSEDIYICICHLFQTHLTNEFECLKAFCEFDSTSHKIGPFFYFIWSTHSCIYDKHQVFDKLNQKLGCTPKCICRLERLVSYWSYHRPNSLGV